MRFGCCIAPDQTETAAAFGFDFCELQAATVLPFEDEPAALPALRKLEAMPIRAEAFNVLVPARLPLCGPQADLAATRTYLRRAFGRMARLGGAAVVFGSGAARRIPEDVPRAQALDQLADAFAMAADEAARAGIDLALEHLNRGECNVFTSLAECQSFLAERGLTGMRLLADLYHLEVEHEPLAAVVAAGPLLAHVHVADGDRRPPGQGGYDYDGFMAALRATGYDRRISAECGWTDFAAEGGDALQFMRVRWERGDSSAKE